ncbi:MAG: hypothetical protein LBS77_01215 [Desulfovibrio sp.]|nr:hypothetical protein [Desulfovibrio sp.]
MPEFNSILSSLEARLPEVFARAAIKDLTGGIFAPGSMANMDSQGCGPAGRFLLAGKSCYRKPEFLVWLKAKLEVENAEPANPVRRGRKAKETGALP